MLKYLGDWVFEHLGGYEVLEHMGWLDCLKYLENLDASVFLALGTARCPGRPTTLECSERTRTS